jgi:hypothetical protein
MPAWSLKTSMGSPPNKGGLSPDGAPHSLYLPDGSLIAEWGCNELPTPQCTSTATTTSFRFRALLTESKQEVCFERVAD